MSAETGQMKVTTRPAQRSSVVLEVEFPADQVRRQVDESVRHLARRTKVPGFRPGKVPRPLLERALGVRRDDPDAANPIYDDAKEHLFERSVLDAVRDQDLDVLQIPDPEWTSFAEDAGATYTVTLPIRPDVKLGAYTDYPFGITIDEINDESVDKVIEQLRDQQASLVPVEGRGAAVDDYAVIRFNGSHDGQPIDGATTERMPLIIGRERFIPGFEDNLIGLSEGDSKTFSVTFPDDYGRPTWPASPPTSRLACSSCARSACLLRTTISHGRSARTTISPRCAPRSRRRLERNALDRARHNFADRIIEFAVANATLDLPDLLIESEAGSDARRAQGSACRAGHRLRRLPARHRA